MDLLGFFFISIIGTILHFTYDWSSKNKYIGLFSAVNESVWEHMKLVVFPFLLWLLIEIPFRYSNNNYLIGKCISLIVMLLLIPFNYYLFKEIFRKNSLLFDIITFYISIGIGQLINNIIINKNSFPFVYNYISLILLVIIIGYFLIATFLPGKSVIYVDPNTKKKGFRKHNG